MTGFVVRFHSANFLYVISHIWTFSENAIESILSHDAVAQDDSRLLLSRLALPPKATFQGGDTAHLTFQDRMFSGGEAGTVNTGFTGWQSFRFAQTAGVKYTPSLGITLNFFGSVQSNEVKIMTTHNLPEPAGDRPGKEARGFDLHRAYRAIIRSMLRRHLLDSTVPHAAKEEPHA